MVKKKNNKKNKVTLEKNKPITEDIIVEKIEDVSEQLKKYQINIDDIIIKHGKKPSVITNIGGHAKRIYFDLTFKDLEYLKDHKNAYINKMLTIWYIGDITNAFAVKILPIKDLSDMGSRY